MLEAQPWYKATLSLARELHGKQVDRSGAPYWKHLDRVAQRVSTQFSPATETEVKAALLHDVFEDTSATEDDLRRRGISDDVISIIKKLTRNKSIPYLEYIKSIIETGDVSALRVKLADNLDNSDVLRPTYEGHEERVIERYKPARALLEQALRHTQNQSQSSVSESKQIEIFKAELLNNLETSKLNNAILLEEYKSIRSEILDRFKDRNTFQITVVIGISAYYGWMFTRCRNITASKTAISIHYLEYILALLLPWAIPVGVALLAYWRSRYDGILIKQATGYLRQVEASLQATPFHSASAPGWETHLFQIRSEIKKQSRYVQWKNKSHHLPFWAFLISVIAVMCVFGPTVSDTFCTR